MNGFGHGAVLLHLQANSLSDTKKPPSMSKAAFLVAPELPSWNQIREFLQSVESLRQTFATA